MKEFDFTLLREVSRSFYLTMRALPAAVRPQIGLAYLLARTTDTIADTGLVSTGSRLDALQRLRERILGKSTAPLNFGSLAQNQSLPAERILLERCEETLGLLGRAGADDVQRIRSVLDVIISGQELDLRRFGQATVNQITALADDAGLDDYTFRVAGCVGRFWTDMCLAHLFDAGAEEAAFLREAGVRFGKGLQLVNILRDLPSDLRKGRCYIPAGRLNESGLTPGDLLSPERMPAFRPLYAGYLDLADSHLTAGWEYTNALPRRQWRLRLACAWPILIGAATLRLLRVENVLDGSRRVKISRAESRRWIVRSIAFYPWPGRWRRLYGASANAVASQAAWR